MDESLAQMHGGHKMSTNSRDGARTRHHQLDDHAVHRFVINTTTLMVPRGLHSVAKRLQ